MDISKKIAQWKQDPEFSKNVGMILVHNGVVRKTSRTDNKTVSRVEVKPDHEKIKALCQQFESLAGIYKVYAKANSGVLEPGDDLLFILVAGDFRENVKPALADLLEAIKKEAVTKKEIKI